MKVVISIHRCMQIMIWSRLQLVANHLQHACFVTRHVSSWFVRYMLVNWMPFGDLQWSTYELLLFNKHVRHPGSRKQSWSWTFYCLAREETRTLGFLRTQETTRIWHGSLNYPYSEKNQQTMQVRGNFDGFVNCLSCGYFINTDPRVMNWVPPCWQDFKLDTSWNVCISMHFPAVMLQWRLGWLSYFTPVKRNPPG